MPEQLYFRYESIGNILRLLVSITYEKTHNSEYIAIYHERFDNEPDEIFESFAEKLYPEGCTIDKPEIENIVKYIDYFMEHDAKTKSIKFKRDKNRYNSYVANIIDEIIIPAGVGQHAQIVQNQCIDYFKHFDAKDLTRDVITNFIRNNIEIKSDFTTIAKILTHDNIDYIIREILIHKNYE